MLLLAWRQLQLDRVRTSLTALVLGAAVAAILVLNGFEQGQYDQLERSVLERQGDLIVVQAGASTFFDRSSLPQLSRSMVEAVPGVAAAHPVTRLPVIYEKHGVRSPITVFITETKGGPRRLLSGRDVSGDRDVVVDESLAVKHDIRVGDPFIVSDFAFTVAGVAGGSAAFFTPFAFISYDGMIDFFLDSELAPDISTFPLVSFLLVDVEPGARIDQVARAVAASVPDVDVFTPAQLAGLSVAIGRTFLGPILGLLVTVGYVVALLAVALIMHVEVATRLRSFAVLKALGFSPRRLYGAVLAHAALLLLIGFPIGMGLAEGTAALVRSAAPLFEIQAFEPLPFAQALLGSMLLAGVGALAPLRSIRRADPALAFERS